MTFGGRLDKIVGDEIMVMVIGVEGNKVRLSAVSVRRV